MTIRKAISKELLHIPMPAAQGTSSDRNVAGDGGRGGAVGTKSGNSRFVSVGGPLPESPLNQRQSTQTPVSKGAKKTPQSETRSRKPHVRLTECSVSESGKSGRFVIEDSFGPVTWHFSTLDVEAPEPDHACGPDCLCWQQKAGAKK